jgi:hypothetical protein
MFSELDIDMILVTRDPRDWVYSAARKIMENPEPFGRDRNTSLSQHIEDLILGFPPNGSVGRHGILERYRRISGWSSRPNVTTIRFEDLVGPQGGGNDSQTTVERIAEAMQITLSPERRSEIAKDLFGGTVTFRRGAIGSWQEVQTLLGPYTTLLKEADEILESAHRYGA